MRWLTMALCAALLSFAAGGAVHAQDSGSAPSQFATGGAPTLEDIRRRQQGLSVDDSARRAAALEALRAEGGPAAAGLGAQGAASDSDLWRAVRYGAPMTVSSPDPNAAVLMQSTGATWLAFRSGPLVFWSAIALGGMLALLALFYLLRGRIRVAKGLSGVLIVRFTLIERVAHWMMAGGFVLLALTGLNLIYGRQVLIPLFGKEIFAAVAIIGKMIHNYVAWAFMLGLALSFLFWVRHNIPNRTDLKWLMAGGGFIGKGHPSAHKFNAGQKIVFWAVMLLGASVSMSGLALLFPYELPMFAKTFAWLNMLGFDLPTVLTPLQEMQFASMWHAVVSVAMMVMILAHIYIGSVGMEGAFDAMGSGKVDRAWAEEHHDLWVAEVDAKAAQQAEALDSQAPLETPRASPAE